jgi:hypothetical protein
MARKREPRQMDRHHRLPRSRGGSNSPHNISIVEKQLHQAWHKLVGNMNAQEVASMLSDTWIDPDYYLVAVPRHKKKKGKRRKRLYCVDCESEVLRNVPKTERVTNEATTTSPPSLKQ